MVRMSAEERRESVIRAAITEFARTGYHGTSTEAIARRVGVSQPYLFRLFPNKQSIFLAASERCLLDVRGIFEAASEGLDAEEAVHAMGTAYQRLIAEDPEKLMMQMQTYVAVASAEAAGDHEFGRSVRAGWEVLWDSAHLALGADPDETTAFLAYGMLINTLVAMGFPAGHRVWTGFYDSARPGAEQPGAEQSGGDRPAGDRPVTGPAEARTCG
ncbi:TetR/AcrR family transcriptional regulator [Streptomyces sp. NPDC058653]|uniref:TetR/AcrR family transcriptional regulator n=1 Tax=Streptomyces sp. NPDC058653 TaxID=3346576 RepID=UPI003669D0BA